MDCYFNDSEIGNREVFTIFLHFSKSRRIDWKERATRDRGSRLLGAVSSLDSGSEEAVSDISELCLCIIQQFMILLALAGCIPCHVE